MGSWPGVTLNHASMAHQHGVGTLRLRSGANADLDKESAMHPSIQTQIMKARTTGAHRTADPARLAHLEDAMPVSTQPGRTRPNSAPAYYLGRPASFWITVSTAARRRRLPAARLPEPRLPGRRRRTADRRTPIKSRTEKGIGQARTRLIGYQGSHAASRECPQTQGGDAHRD
jgi:hypothetical protein